MYPVNLNSFSHLQLMDSDPELLSALCAVFKVDGYELSLTAKKIGEKNLLVVRLARPSDWDGPGDAAEVQFVPGEMVSVQTPLSYRVDVLKKGVF